jgi:hypothetical protein
VRTDALCETERRGLRLYGTGVVRTHFTSLATSHEERAIVSITVNDAVSRRSDVQCEEHIEEADRHINEV